MYLVQKRASSKDVAKEAGVSQSTVSRVFNSSGIAVSEKKRSKVLEAAEKLGYRPSLIARSLNRQSTRIIGIVIRQFENAFYMRALDLFIRRFQDKGYSVMLFNIHDQADIESNLIRALEYQVAGLVITSASLSSPLVERCSRFNTPLFLFNRVSRMLNVSSVCCDNRNGGEQIAEYLYTTGHRRPVYISGEGASSTNQDRQEGFFSGMKSRGIVDIPVIEGDFYYDSGYAAVRQLLDKKYPFDAVFCASDYMAMGFLDAVRTLTNLQVPRDFSLAGFDGIPIMNSNMYPISTYRQPLEAMVSGTVEALLGQIESGNSAPEHHLLRGEILERSSVISRYQ
jgi:DNA-binding LacI/PurR family transcriptional regulator